MNVLHSVKITPQQVLVDGEVVMQKTEGTELLRHLYKTRVDNYPKYYKMDGLSRLGFLASELLLQAEGPREYDDQGRVKPQFGREDRAVVLFSDSGSVHTDVLFERTLTSPEGFYPSPSLFVCTLANIVAGEICIRNRYYGESAMYLLGGKDTDLMRQIVGLSMMDEAVRSALCGWVSYADDDRYEADMLLVER